MSQNTTNDGGPAFPVPNYVNASGETHESKPNGMSLRDYFAAKAMQALVIGEDAEMRFRYRKELRRGDCGRTGFDDNCYRDSDTTYAERTCEDAYIIADAMLEERKKGGAS